MNDCKAFNDDIIGKDKYFKRTFFVKKTREENIRIFDHAIDQPKKFINKFQDYEFEESKITDNK